MSTKINIIYNLTDSRVASKTALAVPHTFSFFLALLISDNLTPRLADYRPELCLKPENLFFEKSVQLRLSLHLMSIESYWLQSSLDPLFSKTCWNHRVVYPNGKRRLVAALSGFLDQLLWKNCEVIPDRSAFWGLRLRLTIRWELPPTSMRA